MSAGADYRALAARYRHLPERVVRAGAAEIQRSVLARLDRDIGSDRRLSGTLGGRRPLARLGVSTKVSPGRNFAAATVTPSPPKARTQWSWIEFGTSPREMPKLHMLVGGAWRTGPFSASGSPAKYTFSRGSADGVPDAERAMAAEFEKAVG